MTESARRIARALLAAAALAAAGAAWGVCVDPGGVGGTGIGRLPAQPGGVGGTGSPAARGGVGGTGISDDGAAAPGSLGVVGVIQGFGSVCVNGLEIEYDAGTPVTVNGRPAAAAELALGQVIAVEARPVNGALTARSIAVLRALEGPVTRTEPGAGRVFVMGQPVRVGDRAMQSVPGLRLAALEPGVVVQVSGLRDAGGEIIASRIDVAPAPGEHSAIGRLARRDARGGDLEGLRVDLPEGRADAEGEVLVRGQWDGARLRAHAVTEDPSTRVLLRVERAVVESLVRASARSSEARVGQFRVRVDPRTRIEGGGGALEIGQRVRVTGVPERDRGIRAERIEIQRDRDARPEQPRRGGEPRSERRGEDRGERARDDVERVDNSGPGSIERPERVDNSGPGRVERPERIDNSGPGRLERPERVERPEGGNSGRH